MDIAVPRDVESSVDNLPGVILFDIDELQTVVDSNLSQRQAAIPDVEEIVAQEAVRFNGWLQSRQVLPVLLELRQKARAIAEDELGRQEGRLASMSHDDQELVNQIVHRIVNKFLHEPTTRLKASAAVGNGVEYADTLCDLFALDVSPNTPANEKLFRGSTKSSDSKNGQPRQESKPGSYVDLITADEASGG